MTDYSISGWCREAGGLVARRVRSSAIVAEFDRIGKPVPEYLTRLLDCGAKYSFEEFDVLSAAMNELYALDAGVWGRIGKLEAKL